MAKTLTLKDENGHAYTLEYNRRTAQLIEKQGFTLDALTSQPNTMIPLLVWGAFYTHNQKMNQDSAVGVYLLQNHKQDLISALADMYADTINTLIDPDEDTGEGDEKNVQGGGKRW